MKFVEANKQKNNRGMALVSVLIVITLIGLLGSSILNLSYLAYQRKLVEKKTTENFYAAESVIDTVKAVLQNSAAEALSSASDGTSAFANAAYKAVVGIDSTSVDADTYEANVKNELYYAIIETSTDVAAAISAEGVVVTDSDGDAIVDDDGNTVYGNGGEFSIGDIKVESNGLRIEDVHVKYINDEGYTSEITTDIVINAPVYASDEDEPVGTYSMFAGSGGQVYISDTPGYYLDTNSGTEQRDMSLQVYLHQEGNVYFGSMEDETTTSLLVGVSSDDSNLNRAATAYASYGGTNLVFNGDIIVANGNTLIFTGGDGSEETDIQVNGYIVLKGNATLLMTTNCNLVCKGIVTDIEYDSDGNVTSITPYTGLASNGTSQTSLYGTVSQFYPYTEDYVKSVNNSSYTSYTSGTLDFSQIMLDNSGSYVKTIAASNLDSRFKAICQGYESVGAGVYILEVDTDDDDTWYDRANDVYHLLTCSTTLNSDGTYDWTWSYTGTTKYYQSNIYCNQSDSKLEQEKKINYRSVSYDWTNLKYVYTDKYYDAEFSEIVNIQLLSQYTNNIAYAPAYIENYSDNVLKTVKWSELKDYLSDAGEGDYWLNTTFDWDTIEDKVNYDLYNRKFYVLKTTVTPTTLSYSKTVTADGDSYVLSNSGTQVEMGRTDDNYGLTSGKMYFWISNREITVHLGTGYYAGLFMSVDKVVFSESKGVARGVSLVELADKLTTNGLKDEDNEVRKFLDTLASAVLFSDVSQGIINSMTTKDSYGYSMMLYDNMFNGGISVFWDRSSSSSDPTSVTAEDNSSIDFVITEDWSKD